MLASSIGAGLLAILLPAVAGEAKLTVDADFPGGNIVVDKVDGDAIHLHQDERDTPRFWFYWCFRVRGAAGRELTFHFTRGNVFGTRGPAASVDAGRTWSWLGAKAVRGDSFRYRFAPEASEVRFAFGIPYVDTDLHDFLKPYTNHRHLRVETLTRTANGREVELLRFGRLDGKPSARVLLTCRHHACEAMASRALEGVIAAVLADTAEGRWFRENVELLAVPFVDKDGVEAGDQGKLRRPHDHWLDYGGASRYPSTRALRAALPGPEGRSVDIALDLHCPYLRDDKIYLATSPQKHISNNTDRFSIFLEAARSGPLAYRAKDNLPFGSGWNGPRDYGERKSFMHWAETLPGVRVVATVELPYASVGPDTVTPAAARAFGADLATAMKRFLMTGQ